jgi:16S rRNA (guanine966-N2)-methyltransferase
MRIIAGKFKGKKLVNTTHLKDLRPTTDRNRETLFNVLSSGKFANAAFSFHEKNILDICCGTGAIGFEALSRGAKLAVFVDKNQEHLDVAKKNAEKLELKSEVDFFLCSAEKFRKNVGRHIEFDLIYLDPPYSLNPSSIIENLLKNKIITANSLLIVESKTSPELPPSLLLIDQRAYQTTTFSFLKLQ